MNVFRWIVTCIVCMSSLLAFSQEGSSYTSFQDTSIVFANMDPSDWVEYFIQADNPMPLEANLLYDIESPGGRHFTYGFTYKGIQVMGSFLKVNLDHSGTLLSVISDFQPVHALSSLSFQSAAFIERKQATYEPDDKKRFEWEPRYEVQAGMLTPIWFEALPLINSPQQRRSGQVVDTTGRGTVFIPDPCTRAEVIYGELFEDADDAHDPIFDTLMDTVTLMDLSYEEDSFLLKGPYVEIVDLVDRAISPVSSPDGDFFFTRDQSGFEDVMAYYHIDRYQRYIQSLGFDNLQNGPIRVDTHGFISDQSEFVPLGESSYLRYGEGGVDDAEDADVLIHEYIHALVYDAARWEQRSCERRGLEEGIADFFAAGYSRDLSLFNWVNIFNWDGHNPFFRGRKATSTTQYPLEECNSSNIHQWGEIWTAAMMNLRNEIGAEEADRIMLQALYGLTDSAGFLEAAQLVREADQLLYEGVHEEWINFYFCQQGIIQGSNCLSVSKQGEIPVENSAYAFFYSDKSEAWVFEWKGASKHTSVLSFSLYDMMGKQVGKIQGRSDQKWSHTFDLASGFYVYQLLKGSTPFDIGKIGVQ